MWYDIFSPLQRGINVKCVSTPNNQSLRSHLPRMGWRMIQRTPHHWYAMNRIETPLYVTHIHSFVTQNSEWKEHDTFGVDWKTWTFNEQYVERCIEWAINCNISFVLVQKMAVQKWCMVYDWSVSQKVTWQRVKTFQCYRNSQSSHITSAAGNINVGTLQNECHSQKGKFRWHTAQPINRCMHNAVGGRASKRLIDSSEEKALSLCSPLCFLRERCSEGTVKTVIHLRFTSLGAPLRWTLFLLYPLSCCAEKTEFRVWLPFLPTVDTKRI